MSASGATAEFVMDFSAIPLSDGLQRLLQYERAEFEAALGRPMAFRTADPAEPAWVVELPDDDDTGPVPRLYWDGPDRLVSVARSEAEFIATLNALHTVVRRPGGSVDVVPVPTVAEAMELVREEIANTYPYFELRGLDWNEICARHLGSAPHSLEGFADFAATWVAELGDAHTAIKVDGTGGFNPPYRGVLSADGVVVTDLAETSAAWEVGVRPGWVIDVGDVGYWQRTVGASPQHVREVQARRSLAFSRPTREFVARAGDGKSVVSWVEEAVAPTLETSMSVSVDRDGVRQVRLTSFAGGLDLHTVFDEVFVGAGRSDHLVVDLRGNAGGSLVHGVELRQRFLRSQVLVGRVAFTDGRGGLAQPQEIWAAPSDRSCWPGTLEIQVDAMTYSASEDFVLGLQGLQYVRVTGSRTGGGSGRPRRIPVLPGVDLTVSTAITYDRVGRPIEFYGIQPDA